MSWWTTSPVLILVSFVLLSCRYKFVHFLLPQTFQASGGDHGREGEQESDICGDEEESRWDFTQTEKRWVSFSLVCSLSSSYCGFMSTITVEINNFNNWCFGYDMSFVLRRMSFVYFFCCCRWPAMCIHGDKSQPERDWVLTGEWNLPPVYSQHIMHWLNIVLCLFASSRRMLTRYM